MTQKSFVAVKEIWQIDERNLGITWSDGKQSHLDVVNLRRACPCAACIDEITKKPILNPASVSDNVRPESVQSVGRYAVSLKFDDGHHTGIYTFDYLRSLS
jgi:ATP-binding protein involved in chromosome partitioning